MLKPEFSEYLPPQPFVDSIILSAQGSAYYPLMLLLHTALGGEKYVKTGLVTKLGHHIGM